MALRKGFRCMTVLIVDDDGWARALLGRILEKNGYLTLQAEDGAEALTIYQSSSLDLIITDIQMPKVSGIELISSVRKMNGEKSRIPIIALTSGSQEIGDEAIKVGADMVGFKPA
ncbi:MAG: response regulator, partial [Blastocatellia bacterium]|nr:response regulator [Blastocatellia bacterium]